MYSLSIQPNAQNLIILMNIKRPKATLKTARGALDVVFEKYEVFINISHHRRPHNLQ
jgi:hypothetical protein